MSASRKKTMVELNGWLAAFDRLLPEDRKRSIQLIEAYNGAVAESRSASGQINPDPFRLQPRSPTLRAKALAAENGARPVSGAKVPAS